MRYYVLILAALLPACTTQSVPRATVAEANSAVTRGQMLNPGDQLKITVFDEPNLTGEYSIDPAGDLAFQLLGKVPSAGRTTAQLSKQIADGLASGGYVLSPKVSVEVLQFRPIYILGEVSKPGEYPFVSDLTYMQAIAKAGGFTARADKKKVVLQRNGWPTAKEIDITATPLLVAPGDTLIVRESFF
jgi:polysaccharide export outer membrane protein